MLQLCGVRLEPHQLELGVGAPGQKDLTDLCQGDGPLIPSSHFQHRDDIESRQLGPTSCESNQYGSA